MTTIHEAEIAGMNAGMLSKSQRQVPAQYNDNGRLAEAWLEAFDQIRQAFRGCVPAPKEPKSDTNNDEQQPTQKRHRAKKSVKTEAEPPQPVKRTMSAILESSAMQMMDLAS